jgi:hypothetical protein
MLHLGFMEVGNALLKLHAVRQDVIKASLFLLDNKGVFLPISKNVRNN